MGIKTAPEILKKTPDEIVIRFFDFSQDDVSSAETLSSLDFFQITREDGVAMGSLDLTKDTQSFSGLKLQLVLSKGLLNVSYLIHLRVITSAGQKLDACGKLKVKDC